MSRSVIPSLLAVSLCFTGLAFAEEAPPPAEVTAQPGDHHRLSVEADPLPFVLSGYDAGLAYQPKGTHLRFLVTHHSIQLPAAFFGGGWTSRARGFTFNGQYFFRPAARGWFVGGQVALTLSESTRLDTPESPASFTTFDVSAEGGYRWFPFDRGLFLQGWLRVGVPIQISQGEPNVGGEPVPRRPVSVYPSLHLGYELAL